MNKFEIRSLNVATPQTLEGHSKPVMSGIHKIPTEERLFLSEVNLDGDGQADLVHHGGRDKAVCVYPEDHFAYWSELWKKDFGPAAFGENITVIGLTEDKVCIGDIFQWGEAVVQVTQPRRPCFKLSVIHNLPELPLKVQETGYSGYYFRVLQTGRVSSKDALVRTSVHAKEMTVAMANRIMYEEKDNKSMIRALLEVEALSDSWRATLSKREASL